MTSQNKNVLVLYYSRHGSTHSLARYVARGIESVDNTNAVLRTVAEVSPTTEATTSSVPESGAPYATIDDLRSCDGLALGSPTRFGNMAAPLKYFLEQTTDLWFSGDLNGKPAGLFTSTSSMHGGQESTLLSMMIPLMHQGMVITGIPYSESNLLTTTSGGTPYGASHTAGSDNSLPISEEEKTLAIALGKRIATLAHQLSSSD